MTTPLSFANRARALGRRIGAMAYDGLLVLALLIVPTVLLVATAQGEIPTGTPLHRVYQLALLAIIVLFYTLSWTRRRQTLGMRAWQLRVVRADGATLRWTGALLRLAASVVSLLPVGLGYLWIVIDRDGLAWHDRLTGSRIEFTPND